MILEPNTYRQLSNEIAFVDQRITDYFSPKGNFPEKMHLSKELGDTACRIPQGYTEQEVRDLLLAVSCSDDCMDHTTVSGSTSVTAFADPRRNAIVNQVGMMMTNSLTIDDFSRQSGISEAYLNGRKKYNELVSQLEQGNTAELRKLVSSGIKNMILSDRTLGRKVSAKNEAYAVNRTLEMAMELLEKHPDLRDPEILNEEDMEDFRIFRGRSAFYKDAHATSGRLLEKLNRGEDLTEEEIAEVIFFNQVQGASEKFEQELETYFEQEILKEFTLPGGLPMPIGQNLIQLEMTSYRLELSKTIPLGKFAGTGELKEYADKIREKMQEIRTAEGYSDFTRAICIGYPQSKQKLLEKVRQSEHFKQVIEQAEQVRRKKASDEKEQAEQEENKLRNNMDKLTSQGVFSGDDIDALLASEGIPKKQIKYDAKVNPENKEYVKALEAQRNGVDLKTDEGWQKIFAQQKQEIEQRANALAPLNKDHKAFNTLSYRAIGEFKRSKEAWLKKMVEANAYDPMTELLRSYPGQVFTLDENGQRVILNPAEGDLREMETGCLKAGEENGLYLMAPSDSENPGAIFGMTFQRNMNSSPEILPIDQYLEQLNQVTMPEKPSWFVRLFAFLIPGFREEVQEYKREWNERQQERAKAEKITENMRKLRSQPASAQQEQNSENTGMSPESVEKLKSLAGDYRKTAQELDPERTVERLKNLLNNDKAPDPELVTLALINSMSTSHTPESIRENGDILTKLLTGDGAQAQEADTLQRSYEELLQRKGENKPLLPADKLLSFYETVMQPETNLQIYKKCACLLAALGENGLQQAMQKELALPAAMKGLLEYGRLSEEAVQICIRETEKAMTDPKARPSKEDLMTVLLCDTFDRDHLLGETSSKLHRDKKTQLLYTPMLRKLGKDGMDAFRTEVGISMGETYFRQQIERGSAVLVSSHRKELGLSTNLEARETQAEEAKKAMQDRQQKEPMKNKI